jgi:hypothetical protein
MRIRPLLPHPVGSFPYSTEAREPPDPEQVNPLPNLPADVETPVSGFPEGTDGFVHNVRAVSWAQNYARAKREGLIDCIPALLSSVWPDLVTTQEASELEEVRPETPRPGLDANPGPLLPKPSLELAAQIKGASVGPIYRYTGFSC